MAAETFGKRTAIIKITYSVNGFEPRDTNAYTGQRIEWINGTDKEIPIKQTASTHAALKNGLSIKPRGSVTFRPLVNGLFTYLEVDSGKYSQ